MRMTYVLVALAIAGGCGKKSDDKKAGTAAGEPATKQLADQADPPGVTFARVERPFGSLELPGGADWQMVENQYEGKDGTVVMLQAQDGIAPDQIDDYLASYNDVQKRDAPKWAAGPVTKGAVNGQPAARVEGAFDNGTKFVTRDYLVFTKGKVVMIGARTPAANPGKLAGIVDHAARSLQAR